MQTSTSCNESLSPKWTFEERFKFMKTLGEGSFGEVSKHFDRLNSEAVAIKRIKDGDSESAAQECAILQRLQECDPDTVNIICFKGMYSLKHDSYLVFEYLEQDLRTLVSGKSFPLAQIRIVGLQLMVALDTLKNLNIIHTDIKPENIMVVDLPDQVLRVKLIDFGSAIQQSGPAIRCGITTLIYRSPEVILGVASSEAIDVWSVGLVLIEMFLGRVLYNAVNEEQMLEFFAQTHGQFAHLFVDSIRFKSFYARSAASTWVLKNPCRNGRRSGLPKGLNVLEKMAPPGDDEEAVAEQLDLAVFAHLVEGMMELDGRKRICPLGAVRHDFMTLHHIWDYEECRQ